MELKVGDKVFHLITECRGTVRTVYPEKGSFAVRVDFINGTLGTYTTCGKVWEKDPDRVVTKLTKLHILLYGIED